VVCSNLLDSNLDLIITSIFLGKFQKLPLSNKLSNDSNVSLLFSKVCQVRIAKRLVLTQEEGNLNVNDKTKVIAMEDKLRKKGVNIFFPSFYKM
jgi:hypothetical protein